ncbi:hypothetical protein QYE76_041949 [Lolium multiflorum]|uniref:Reverse transcriptase domain-containing protein n=1 Tax=Lolium multiflorum TaxID=4521 RepID=A0AAD8TGC0_LOLMU|nr:hypothetical protein QYE76_041949 [Lolium multiflorum]
MAVPHYTYLLWRVPGPNRHITVKGSFALADKCDKDFHILSETFGMQAEYNTSKLLTDYDVLPDGGRPLKEQTFDTTKNSKKVQIHPTDLKKTTAIATNITMLFGLKNAGATYQWMMQKCLATQIGKNVQVYIADIAITTKKSSSLIDDLKETFDNLDKFCLKLNPTKCSFGVPAGELLGYLVSTRGIEENPEKIQPIVTMRKPTKLKEIQQLTGRVAALRRFFARLG